MATCAIIQDQEKIIVSRDVIFVEDDFSAKNLLNTKKSDEIFQGSLPISVIHQEVDQENKLYGLPNVLAHRVENTDFEHQILNNNLEDVDN